MLRAWIWGHWAFRKCGSLAYDIKAPGHNNSILENKLVVLSIFLFLLYVAVSPPALFISFDERGAAGQVICLQYKEKPNSFLIRSSYRQEIKTSCPGVRLYQNWQRVMLTVHFGVCCPFRAGTDLDKHYLASWQVSCSYFPLLGSPCRPP